MPKRDEEERKRKNDKLERTIRRNWVICGVSLAAIIILYFISK